MPPLKNTVHVPYWYALTRAERSARRQKNMHRLLVLLLLVFQNIVTPYSWADAPISSGLPYGAEVVQGQANISQPSVTHLDVTTHSERTAVNWQSFDIAEAHSVAINQPSAQALTLNRIKNGAPTKIFGTLTSNGRVVVANPAGVWFGPNSHVDVAGLVAAAAEIAPENIQQDVAIADAATASAGVLADGAIIVRGPNSAALLGRSVEQRGKVTVENSGQAVLAAAESFAINLRADGRLEVQVTGATATAVPLPDGRNPTAAVSQQGAVTASNGIVKIAAAIADSAFDEAINIDGTPQATRAVLVGDAIELHSTGDGMVRVKGTLLADASHADGAGGKVRVFGQHVAVEEGAVISARGGSNAGAGGSILVGGDYLGQRSADAPPVNAKRTFVANNANLDASAGQHGDGGKIIVWADDAAFFAGTAKAEAGKLSGNGGFIEVSGARTLGFYGAASVAAPAGQQGRILLDPRDITIAAVGADDGNISTHRFFANPSTVADVVFSAAAVQALTGAVELQASRNIIVNAALDFNNVATTSVNFRAGQAITVSAPIQASGGASLLFNANDPGSSTRLATANINIGANLGGLTTGAITFSNNGGTGYINLTANQTWQTNNAAINAGGMQIRADAGNNNRTLNVNAGTNSITLAAIGTAATVPGNISLTGGTVTVGAVITGEAGLTRAGGDITINSTAGLANVGALTTVGGLIGNVGQAGGAVNITGVGVTVGAINTAGRNAGGSASNGGAGGAVTINTGTGALSATTLSTIGGNATTTGMGGAGGSVNISGTGNLVMTTVTTSGGTTVTGTAGSAGAITLNTSAALTAGTLTANGGAATGAGIARHGGNINLTGATSLTLTGNLNAVGGNTAGVGGTNGNGANIIFNNNLFMNQNNNTNISNNGGVFAGVATGTGGTQTYSGSFTYQPAANRTLTMNAGSGSINYSSSAINFNGSTFDMQADSYVFPTAVNSLTTTGNVLLRPGTDSTTIGIGAGAGSWQFTQTVINAINPTAGTLTIGRGSGTGLITISGVVAFNNDNITIQSGGAGGNILFTSTADVDMATTGNRTLLLVSGTAAGNTITLQNGALLTNNSGATGNTIFATRSLVLLGPTGAVNGNGNLTLRGPATNSSVGFGGAAGAAQFTQAQLDAMPSFVGVIIGDGGGTGAVNIAGSLSQTRNVTIQSGGGGGTVNLNPTAAISLTGGTARTLTIASGSNAADTLTIQNGATLSNTTGATGAVIIQANTLSASANAGALSGNGTLTIRAVGNGNTMGIGTGTGQLVINNAVLAQFGGFVSQAFGRGHTNTVNINGVVTLDRTTTITANGNNGAIVLGASTNLTMGGTNQALTFNTGTGTTYTSNANSLVFTSGAVMANNTGGNVSLVTNRISAGDADAFSGTGALFIQPTADTITTGIGTSTGALASYGLADLAVFNGFSSQTFGRNAGTVSLALGGAVTFERTTTLRQGGANGLIRFLSNADVEMSGTNLTLTINAGSGTTYTGTPAINSISFDSNARLANNTGAASAILLNANNLVVDATVVIEGNGTATIQPLANNVTVGVGTGAGTAQYTAAELQRFSGFNMLNIGRTDHTVALTVNGSLPLDLNTTFRSGGGNGTIDLGAAADIVMSGSNRQLLFTPGNGTGGSAAQNVFSMAATAQIENNTGAASAVTINANKINVASGAAIEGNGIVTIQPNATGQSVGLGSGAGGLAINNAALGALTGFVQQIFGSATGTAALTADGTITFGRNTILRSQGNGGTITNAATAAIAVTNPYTLDIFAGSAAANSFTHTLGAVLGMGSGALSIHANTINLTGNDSISGTGSLLLQSATAANTMGFGSAAGQLAITAAALDVFSGFSGQTFGRTDGVGAVNANALSYERDTTIRGGGALFDIAGVQTVSTSGESITISMGAPITFSAAGGIVTNNGVISLADAVVLATNTTFDSNNANISFSSTINSDAITRNLTVDAGSGQITFAAALGALQPLGAVSLTAGQSLALPAITTTGSTNDLSINLSAGNLTQSGVLNLGGDLEVTANTVAAQSITLNQNNLIQGTVRAATSSVNGGNISLTNAAPTGTTIGDSATAGNYTVTSTLGNITQENSSTLNVGGTLSITAPAGTFVQAAGAEFSANNLRLQAANTPVFGADNVVNNLAAAITTGSFNYTQNTALQVSNVSSLIGVQAQSILLRTTSGDITLNEDIVASASGNAIVVAAGEDFINNAGTNALQPGTGRWLIYSTSPNGTPTFALGGLTPSAKRYNRTYTGYGPASVTETGNVLLFAVQPTLTFTADNTTRVFGDPNPTFTYSVAGFIDGDNASTAFAGVPALSTAAVPLSAVAGSPYAITITQNTLASALGYAFSFADGALTVTPRALTVTANNTSRIFGDPNPSFSASFNGFATGEGVGNLSGALGFSTPAGLLSPVGSYAITPSGLSSSNYAISFVDGVLTVTSAIAPFQQNPVSANRQDIIPSFIYTRQPSRIVEMVMQLGLSAAALEGDGLGRAPTGLFLPFERTRNWREVVSEPEESPSDATSDFYETSL